MGAVKEPVVNFFFFFSGDVVFIHGAAATPLKLVAALTEHGKAAKIHDVTLCHIHTEGPALYTQPECEGECFTRTFILTS